MIDVVTRCYMRIMRMVTRGKVVQGGSGAGKTRAIVKLMLKKLLSTPYLTSTVLGATYPKLKDGPLKDAEIILREWGYDWSKMYNASTHDIRLPSGSVLQFRHLKNYEEHQGKSIRRDDLYVLEANSFSWAVIYAFIQRTHGTIYIDYNPDVKFWAHEELPKLRNADGSKIFGRIITTYKDNHFLPESERNAILARKDDVEWFRVYGEGLTGIYNERQVYTFKEVSIIPRCAELVGYGQDYGYYPDKTCLVAIFRHGYDIYPKLIFSENNLNDNNETQNGNMTVAEKMLKCEIDKTAPIFADTSAPKARRDISDKGYNIYAVSKTDVLDGIKEVKKFNLKLAKSEVVLKAACRSYLRKIDKLTGRILPEAQGHEPDEIAGMRYMIMSIARAKNAGDLASNLKKMGL